MERKLLILGSIAVWLVGVVLVATLAGQAILIMGSFLASATLEMYLQVAYTFTAESFPAGSALQALP